MSNEIIAGIIGATATIIAALIQDSLPETKRRWLVSIGVGLACVAVFFVGHGLYQTFTKTETSNIDEQSDKGTKIFSQEYWVPAEMKPQKEATVYFSTECQHDPQYSMFGLCGLCKAWLPNMDDDVSVDSGDYYVKSGETAYLRAHPYMLSNEDIGELLATLNQSSKVSVDRAVKNGLGNLWYHVTYFDMDGFIVSDKLHAHDSQYWKSGLCGTCGEWLPNRNNHANVERGVYVVPKGKTAYLRVHPYKLSNEDVDELLATLHYGDEVEVVSAVINGLGNLWYEVFYRSWTVESF